MDLLMVILFVLHHRVSALDDLYSESGRLGGSCFPRDTCQPPRSDGEDHLWGNHTCECGPHCIRYATCCADSPHAGQMLRVEYRQEACRRLSTSFPQPVLATSSCSERWRSEFHVRNKCEAAHDGGEDPMSAVPVTSLSTSVTYKNYFCAMCNYDSQNVHMWDIGLQFATRESVPGLSNVTEGYLLENIVYDDVVRAWGIVANDSSFYKVKFKHRVPPVVKKFVKRCYPNIVTRCGPSFQYHRELRYKCSSYYAPIRLREEGKRHLRKFRNVHCALCNGVNATSPDFDVCILEADDRRTKPSFSFAHLLDINGSDGPLVGTKTICGEREKWDPFFKKCRSLACALPGYVIRDGACVQS